MARRLTTALAVALPALVAGSLVWQRRWVSDDGFINVRVIHQLMAGNGPVHNLGERVEVGTSTLWLALVWLGQALVPGAATGEVMVVLGTALTLVALVVLGLGARHLAPDADVVLPLGLAVLAGTSVFWDFGTSGLETPLTFAWIATCFAALARRWATTDALRPAWQPWPVAWVIGLGPLIRPDLALVSFVFGVMLLFQSRPSWRGWAASAGIALSTPVAYEVFRMGYYAALVPNTALAKAGASLEQGLVYLRDFADTYYLAIPVGLALIVIVAGALAAARDRDLGLVALWLGPLVAAGAHGGFVVSVGGDFMHGRFLLPALVLLMAPVAVVRGRAWRAAAAGVVIGWALVSALTLRPALWNGMIVDERSYYADFVPDEPGASVREENWAADIGYQTTRQAARDLAAGQSYVLDITRPEERLPTASGEGVVVWMNSLGIAGVGAGLDVTMVDPPSLGDPIGSRLVLPAEAEYRVGHAYKPVVWTLARYADPAHLPGDAALIDARAALECGDIPDLVAAISEPLTPERFLRNLTLAPRLTMLRIPVDPAQARVALCG